MASREETQAYWDKRWERERKGGRNRYLFRNTVAQGILPGLVGGGILMFVQPHVGAVNIGLGPWPAIAFLGFSACGFIISLWWWRTGERRFHERGSTDGS